MGKRVKSVMVSAGHSDTDPGATSSNSGHYVCERDEVWEIAELTAEYLREYSDVKVYRDHWDDKWFKAVDRANEANVDLMVEFHENAGGGDGAEVIIYSEKTQYIADAFKKQFEAFGQNWRRTIIDPEFTVCWKAHMPSCIVECCFVDSKDVLIMDSTAEKKRLAKYMAKAICDILGEKLRSEKPEKKPSSSGSSKPPRKPKTCEVLLPDVRLGDKFPAARRAMMLLKARGYLPDNFKCAPGAVFNKTCVDALKTFQKKNGLKQDGWIGKKTWYELLAD